MLTLLHAHTNVTLSSARLPTSFQQPHIFFPKFWPESKHRHWQSILLRSLQIFFFFFFCVSILRYWGKIFLLQRLTGSLDTHTHICTQFVVVKKWIFKPLDKDLYWENFPWHLNLTKILWRKYQGNIIS